MKAFMGNSYPHSYICSASAGRAPREDDGEKEEERPLTVHLPYVAGVSERIRRACKDFNIRWCSSPDLPSVLSSLRSKTPSLCRAQRLLSTVHLQKGVTVHRRDEVLARNTFEGA